MKKNLEISAIGEYAALQYIASHKRRAGVGNTFISKWSSLTEDAFKASKELEDINTKILDKVTENQINLSNAFLEANTNFFETLSETKKYPDLLVNHNKLLNSFSEVFSKAATNTEELMATVKSDYEEWIKKGIQKPTS